MPGLLYDSTLSNWMREFGCCSLRCAANFAVSTGVSTTRMALAGVFGW